MKNYFDESLVISVQRGIIEAVRKKLYDIIALEVYSDRKQLAVELLNLIEETKNNLIKNI